MKKKRLLKLVIPISLVAALAVALPLTSGCRPAPPEEVEPVKIGYIGCFAYDSGRSSERSAEIAIEEFNAAGGILGGRQIEYVKADTGGDVTEGVKAYEYLNEVEDVDFIISGCIDDVSLGWMPRMAEYEMPTLDTWTSAVKAIEMVRDDYEHYKYYFLNFPCDWLLAVGYLDFGKEVLKEEMGWDTFVLFQEDTAYAAGVAEFIVAEVGPWAGLELIDHVVYDVETVDFSPIYAGIVAKNPDFIYHISSVNCVVPTAQYVELQVPVPITGINVAAFGMEYWEDTGGMGGGISTLQPAPCMGMEHDPRTLAFLDKYTARYAGNRPEYPHFNGFNAYYGIYQAVEAAERVYAAGLGSGFYPRDAWIEEMEDAEITLLRDGGPWYKYCFYKPGEVEPITGEEFPHNGKMDFEGIEGFPSVVVVQWYEDGTVKCIWPPKYALGEMTIPAWCE